MLKLLFAYFIFPGLIFSATVGLLAGWLERKISARLQWRLGPPWYQNFVDIVKLLGKETILPEASSKVFVLAPLLSVLSLSLVATILGVNLFGLSQGFSGDLIVLVYLLTIPALAAIIGASSSRNPLASVGASREIKLLLAYELPFILAIVAVVIRSGGVIHLSQIISYQKFNHSHIFSASGISLSGLLALVVGLLVGMAKLGMGPFDVSEAEQEIMGGVMVEYSGLPLALFKLSKAMLMYIVPVFLISLFLAKDTTVVFLLGKLLFILIVFILVKNTNPRLRIDQIIRFFWGPVTLLAVLAVGLAILGW